MGAVATKIGSESRPTPEVARVPEPSMLPQGPQVWQFVALAIAVPGAMVVALATSLLAMWAVNGGDVIAWSLFAAVWTVYGLAALPAIGASFAERT